MRGRILFYTAGSRNGLEGNGHRWASDGTTHKKEVVPKKKTLFCYRKICSKHIEDAKQGQKVAPDLVESIMKGSGLVKEELRRISCKMRQFRSKITKITVSTFWMSGKSTDSCRRPTQPSRLVSFKPFFTRIDPSRPNKSRNCRFFVPPGAFYPSRFEQNITNPSAVDYQNWHQEGPEDPDK